MKLSDYISTNETNIAEFAKSISVSVQAIHRYSRGERVPRPAIMAKITEVTAGAVTPNDFYAGAAE